MISLCLPGWRSLLFVPLFCTACFAVAQQPPPTPTAPANASNPGAPSQPSGPYSSEEALRRSRFGNLGVDPAVQYSQPKGVDLQQYIEQVRSYAHSSLEIAPRKPVVGPGITSLASSDPTLAKHQDIRDITKGILMELDKLDTFAAEVFRKIEALRKKSQISSSGPTNPRKNPPTSPFMEEIKLQKPLLEKKDALKKDIDRRLALMEVKIDTPAAKEFFMPFDSPFYQAMIHDNPSARRFPGQ